MDQFVSFGNWVRHRRKILDLTQADLARKVSCSLSMLRKIERDERRPSDQLAELLAGHLAIDDSQRSLFLQMARGHYVPDMPAPAEAEFDQPATSQPADQRPSSGNPFIISSGAVLLLVILLLLLSGASNNWFGFFSREYRGPSSEPTGKITTGPEGIGSENGGQSLTTISVNEAKMDRSAQALGGTKVIVEGPFGADGLEIFEQSMRPFEERTGIDIEFRSVPEVFESYIASVVAAGNPPDIASFPQPGYLADFARQDQLVELGSFLGEDYLRQQYSESFLELAMVDGRVFGAPHLASLKGLIWYAKDAFEAAGYEVPQTWDELMALSEKMASAGHTPWCIGIENGDASGWIGTDWVETILLRTAPPETYDAWTRGELPFDSVEIRRAFDLMEPIWLNSDYVYGGTAGIMRTSIFNAPALLMEDPPGCYLLKGATWSPGLFSENAVYGEDYDFFVLPAIDPQYGEPLLGAGSFYAMFNDRPEVREVMRYLTTGESIKPFAESGAYVSSHRDVPLEWYTTPRQIRYVQLISEAGVYRYDGSDLMPGEVAFEFNQGIVDWVEGRDLVSILQEIDSNWPDES